MLDQKNHKEMVEESMEAMDESPLDPIIAKLDEYIADPKLATAETLTALKEEIVDLKTEMDSEGETDGDGDEKKSPAIAIMVGMRKGGQK